MARNIKTVADFAKSSGFTEPQVRWWIFNGEQNGLTASGAIIRIGRRVYVDVDGFDEWLRTQNPDMGAASASPRMEAGVDIEADQAAKRLAKQMASKGASLRQIEEATGIPKSTAGRLVRAERAAPPVSVESLEAIQMHVLNAMHQVRSGDTKAAVETLSLASSAVSRAIASVGQVQP